MTKNLSNFPDDQFPFIIHTLISKKTSLLQWAKKNKKEQMIKDIEQEIEILREAERRLEQHGL